MSNFFIIVSYFKKIVGKEAGRDEEILGKGEGKEGCSRRRRAAGKVQEGGGGGGS